MEHDQPNEATRLLGDHHDRRDLHSDGYDTDHHEPNINVVQPPSANQPVHSTAWRTIFSTAAVLLILNIGSHITLVPQTAILQDIVCANYYADREVPSPSSWHPTADDCKVEPVQSEVAYINAWKDVFEALPAMILAVPYGRLADRIGRKKVLLLAIAGCLLNDTWTRVVYWFSDFFPLRAVWFGGLWQLIGAGAATFSSVSFVLVADVCPAEQRTTAFAQIQAATLVSRLVFVPAGGALTSINPWIPMTIGLMAMVTSFFVAVAFVPETLSPSAAKRRPSGEAQAPIDSDGINPRKGARDRVRAIWEDFARLCNWVTRNARVVVILSSFLLLHLGEQADTLLILQYVAKRLGWTIGKASYITSVGAAVNLAVLTFIIPALSSFLVARLDLHEMAKDKLIAQLSGVFLVFGSATVALGTSWGLLALGQVLYFLGDAFEIPARSLVTGMVDQRHLGTLYTLISVLTYTGAIAGEPVFAEAFRWGMRWGDMWLGTPFLIAAGCFLLALAAISGTPVRAGENHAGDGQDRTGADVEGQAASNRSRHVAAGDE